MSGGRYRHIGAAIVPIGQRDRANAFMRQQGFGEDVFAVPIGPEQGEAITAVANFQPVDVGLAAALNMCVEYLQGDWLPIDEEADPMKARSTVDRELLKSRLKIKRWKDAT